MTSNDDSGGGEDSLVVFRAQRGRTYTIIVDSFTGEGGEFGLNLSTGGVRGVGLTLDTQPDQTLATTIRRGLQVDVGYVSRCTVAVDLVATGATARRLGLPTRRGRALLARTQGTLRGNGRASQPDCASTPAPALRCERAVTLQLRATLVGSPSPDKVLARRILLNAASG